MNKMTEDRPQQGTIQIGRVIRNGVFFKSGIRKVQTMNTDSLFQSVEKLFSMLATQKIDFVLVGGIALLQYIEGRNTEDIDLIVAVSSLKKLSEIKILEQDENFARGYFEELKIDFLLTENPVFAKVQREHTHLRPFLERDILTATVEGLILLKLYALPSLYRQGNFAKVGIYENDVATLIFYHQPDMNRLTSELEPFLNRSDFSEILNIVKEIENRLSRFDQKSSES